MSHLDQIYESIEARLAELRHEISTLEAARAALDGDGAGAGAGAHGPSAPASKVPVNAAAPSRKPRSRGRRSAKSAKAVEVLLAGKLETMLSEAEDGLSATAISKRANAAYVQVLDLLRALESTGQVRRTGSRRTSLWRLITDEERIAERAAELERLSVSKS